MPNSREIGTSFAVAHKTPNLEEYPAFKIVRRNYQGSGTPLFCWR